jgi:hypothetical protein
VRSLVLIHDKGTIFDQQESVGSPAMPAGKRAETYRHIM